MDKRLAKKLLLIGWDGADWKTINTLLDAGKMPALERFVNSGVMGNLATLHPSLSPMLWTSIATGMRPFKHGIHGFTEPDPSNGGIRPVTSTQRRDGVEPLSPGPGPPGQALAHGARHGAPG
jgi:predicted AlkP superfamily phosphohydrolase/phosphomutase